MTAFHNPGIRLLGGIPRCDGVDRGEQFVGGRRIEILGGLHRGHRDPVEGGEPAVIGLPRRDVPTGGRLHPLGDEVPGDGVLEFPAMLLLDHRPPGDGVERGRIDLPGELGDLRRRLSHGHRIEPHSFDLRVVVVDPARNLAVGRQGRSDARAGRFDDGPDVGGRRIQRVDGGVSSEEGGDDGGRDHGVLHGGDLLG